MSASADQIVLVPNDLGDGEHRWGHTTDGNLIWGHDCTDRYQLQRIDLTSGQYHRLITLAPLHIEASVICTDCQDHGYIRGGVWVPA